MIRSHSDALETKEFTQFNEERLFKLGTEVSCKGLRCTLSSNPRLQEGEGTGLSATLGQSDGFTPFSESIHTGKEETAPS